MFERTTANDCLDWVPESLEQVPPGYVLAAMLDDIDMESCSGFDRIRVLRAQERMQAHYTARSYRTMTRVLESIDETDIAEDTIEDAASAEIAAALRLTRRSADQQLQLAIELHQRLPSVQEALCNGSIDVRRARTLVDDTLHLSVAQAREVVGCVLDDAGLLTIGQLRAKLRKLCMDVDPDEARERYRHAVEDRRVVVEPTVDGTAELHAVSLPPHRVQAAMRRINHLALDLKHNGDTRSMDQLRADVLLDLIEGQGPAVGRGVVNVNVDLATLTHLQDHPGELNGYGPVVADIARRIAEHQQDTEWRWTLKDPDTGQPIDGGTTRRRPTTAQRRNVTTLHPVCIHPGCRMPYLDCDLDHTTPWAETHQTYTDDLAPLCRYHHRIRHQAHWTYKPQPKGDYLFTTPLGHTYTTSGRDP